MRIIRIVSLATIIGILLAFTVACGSSASSLVYYDQRSDDHLVYRIFRNGDGPVEYHARMSKIMKPKLDTIMNYDNVEGLIIISGKVPLAAKASDEQIETAVGKARDFIKKEYDKMMAAPASTSTP